MNRTQLMATGLLIGAFTSGAIVGGAASAFAERRDTVDPPKKSYADRLSGRLDLNPYQYVSVEEFVDLYDAEVHQLWLSVRPQADSLRDRLRDNVMAALDEEQREIYQSLIRRSDSIRAERRLRHDSGKD